MNVTATTEKITALDFDTITKRQPRLRVLDAPEKAEDILAARITEGKRGKSLLKFCRELSTVLVRSYMVENDADELREKLCSSLMLTLACSYHHANCLVDLSLELIHAKVHHEIRRSNDDLDYLISHAGKALSCEPVAVS